MIGLTATPSKQTFGFFNQNLVMEYNHEQAVADGVNVDFDVYKIRTRITDQGSLDADSYVVALGSAAARLLRPLGIDLPIYPVKGYSVTIDIDTNVPVPRSSVMDEHYKVMITRLGARLRAAGIAELSGYDVSIRPSGPATVLRSLRELFPQAAIAREAGALNAWAGLRPMTPDGPPYLGATGIANLYVNVGQGSNGWTQACGCGRVVADIVCGRRPEIDLEGFSIDR